MQLVARMVTSFYQLVGQFPRLALHGHAYRECLHSSQHQKAMQVSKLVHMHARQSVACAPAVLVRRENEQYGLSHLRTVWTELASSFAEIFRDLDRQGS